MKIFILVISAATFLSCSPEQEETNAIARQPKPIPLPNASSRTPQQKTAKKRLAFEGHYGHALNITRKTSGYGVISLENIDRKNKRVSFSASFFGKRNAYAAPFEIVKTSVEGDPQLTTSLEVNTKKFHFSTDGQHLWIDLFNGSRQAHSMVKMLKLNPFKYDASNSPDLGLLDMSVSEKLENASQKLLLVQDIANLNRIDLQIMKQSIYARHGLSFENKDVAQRFGRNAWYVGIFTKDEVDKKLSEIEVKNIDLISRFEKRAKPTMPRFKR